MSILTLLVVIPVLTITGIILSPDATKTRLISAIGMGLQLILAAVLVYLYLSERKAGNADQMLFMSLITSGSKA